MPRDLSEAPIPLLNDQDVKTYLCAKFGFIVISVFRNATNKLFLPVTVFDPGLKVLGLDCFVPNKHGKNVKLASIKHIFTPPIIANILSGNGYCTRGNVFRHNVKGNTLHFYHFPE